MSTRRSSDSDAFLTFPEVRYTSNSLINTSKYCDSRFNSLRIPAQNSKMACECGNFAPNPSIMVAKSFCRLPANMRRFSISRMAVALRSEEHTSELQSRLHLVCRLLLEKKKFHVYIRFDAEKSVLGIIDALFDCVQVRVDVFSFFPTDLHVTLLRVQY